MCEGNSHQLFAWCENVYSCARLLRVYQLLTLRCSCRASPSPTKSERARGSQLAAGWFRCFGLGVASKLATWSYMRRPTQNLCPLRQSRPPLLDVYGGGTGENTEACGICNQQSGHVDGDVAQFVASASGATAASSLRGANKAGCLSKSKLGGLGGASASRWGWWDGGMWWDGWWGMLPGVGLWIDGSPDTADSPNGLPVGAPIIHPHSANRPLAPHCSDRGGSAILASRTLPLVVSKGEIPQSQSQRASGLVSTLNLRTGKNATLWRGPSGGAGLTRVRSPAEFPSLPPPRRCLMRQA